MLSAMVTRTTGYKIRYQLPSGGSMQPLDANGVPLPVIPSGFYDVALPIHGAGHAWGTNRISRALMTVADADRATVDGMDRDMDTLRRRMMAAIFTNTTYAYADERYGNLTIQPFANNDTTVFVRRGGSASTDNHYLAQAAAIADATNPFGALYRTLDEHPSNTGPYIAYVATNLAPSIEGLTALLANFNANINYGANVNTLAGASITPSNTSRATGGELTKFGNRLIGYINGMYIVEWAAMPDNYIIAHASSATDALGMREYEAPELQGLFAEFDAMDGNLNQARLLRFCGFGALNRVAIAVMRVGNASYAIPANYQAPIVA